MSRHPEAPADRDLLVYNGDVVQTRRFRPTNNVGSAFTAVDFFNTWTVDEIFVLEISKDDTHRARFEEIVEGLSRRCFVPLTVGGKIRDLDRVRTYTRAGADKIALNTGGAGAAGADQRDRRSVRQPMRRRLDRRAAQRRHAVGLRGGRRSRPGAAAGATRAPGRRRPCGCGAGEILLNEIEHDGDKRGYDLDLVRMISDAVSVPVIAMGGVANWDHLVEGVRQGHAHAVAAGNIFHYTEHSTKKAKEFMAAAGLPVRGTTFYKVAMPRRPAYRPF